MKKICLILFAACGLILSASPVFENKKSDWRIVVAPGASETELYAAQELQYFLNRISGVKLPVKRDGEIGAGNSIVIGTAGTFAGLPEAVKNFPQGSAGNDSLRVRTLDGNLYLTGNVPRGALYAVYTFLKNTMCVRWFSAGKNGEYYFCFFAGGGWIVNALFSLIKTIMKGAGTR